MSRYTYKSSMLLTGTMERFPVCVNKWPFCSPDKIQREKYVSVISQISGHMTN